MLAPDPERVPLSNANGPAPAPSARRTEAEMDASQPGLRRYLARPPSAVGSSTTRSPHSDAPAPSWRVIAGVIRRSTVTTATRRPTDGSLPSPNARSDHE